MRVGIYNAQLMYREGDIWLRTGARVHRCHMCLRLGVRGAFLAADSAAVVQNGSRTLHPGSAGMLCDDLKRYVETLERPKEESLCRGSAPKAVLISKLSSSETWSHSCKHVYIYIYI